MTLSDEPFMVWHAEGGETEEDAWLTKAWDAEEAAADWVENYIDNGNLEGNDSVFTLTVRDSLGILTVVECTIDWSPNIYARTV